jgi:hypothetical protein
MVAIYVIKDENNVWLRIKHCKGKVRLSNGKYRVCGRGFKNGQRVVRTTFNEGSSNKYGRGERSVYHIEHLLDAHGEQLYE